MTLVLGAQLPIDSQSVCRWHGWSFPVLPNRDSIVTPSAGTNRSDGGLASNTKIYYYCGHYTHTHTHSYLAFDSTIYSLAYLNIS